MNLIGIGIDIEEVGRFRKLPFKKNREFYKKIFTDPEIEYCLSKSDPAQHFTARFCTKEAMSKALGREFAKVKEIEILNDKNGAPQATINGKKSRLKISLSHTKSYATAVAIAY